MEVVFWSPARGGQTTRNMKILANIYRIRYGMQVRTFENYEAYGKYHFMENMQKQNRQKKNRNCLKLAPQPLFLLIYLYYEVKGKSTKQQLIRFEYTS